MSRDGFRRLTVWLVCVKIFLDCQEVDDLPVMIQVRKYKTSGFYLTTVGLCASRNSDTNKHIICTGNNTRNQGLQQEGSRKK